MCVYISLPVNVKWGEGVKQTNNLIHYVLRLV